MAIYWVDPYLESPSGGVDGTTGVGTIGSYANPYSVDNLTAPTGFNLIGDEIRIKALPANPWITGPLWGTTESLEVNNGGFFGVLWLTPPPENSFLKYTTIKGDEQYLNWSKVNVQFLKADPTPWETAVPYGDLTIPAYKLDPQYYLSNLVRPDKNMFFRGQDDKAVTVTAGWVSESARGGETIIHRVGQTSQNEFWFGYTTIYKNKMVVDAPELTISHTSTSNGRKVNIYGKTVELHDVNMRNTYSTSNRVSIYTSRTFKANCLASGGYIDFYSPNEGSFIEGMAEGVNRDVKHLLGGYNLSLKNQGSSNSHDTHLKFKTLSTYLFSQSIDAQLSYYNNFYFMANQKNGHVTPSEMALDPAVNADPSPPFQRDANTLSPIYDYNSTTYDTRTRKLPIQTYGKYLTGGARVGVERSSSYFKELVLPPSGTLENTTSHGVVSIIGAQDNRSLGKLWGVDKNSGRRMAFAPQNSQAKELMMMYNSTEYGGKLVYHLMPNVGYSFDRVHIDMPTGLSEILTGTNLRLKYTLGGTTQGGVDLLAYLEGNCTEGWNSQTTSNWVVVDASDGGDDAVVYQPFPEHTSQVLAGSQALTMVLLLRVNWPGMFDSYGPSYIEHCAKICIKSIELEVV